MGILKRYDWSAVVIDEGHSLKGGCPTVAVPATCLGACSKLQVHALVACRAPAARLRCASGPSLCSIALCWCALALQERTACVRRRCATWGRLGACCSPAPRCRCGGQQQRAHGGPRAQRWQACCGSGSGEKHSLHPAVPCLCAPPPPTPPPRTTWQGSCPPAGVPLPDSVIRTPLLGRGHARLILRHLTSRA